MSDEMQRERPRRQSAIAEVLKTAAQALVLFLLLSVLIGRFEVHQISMEPTFHEGERVLVSKVGTLWSNLFVRTAHAAEASSSSPFALKHGQVVVFYRTAARDEDALIKRVIGVPGDMIEFLDGQVLINGAALDEPYLHGLATSCGLECGPVTLGPDEYFVMGDNRTNSLDSRNFGPIPASQIVGRVVVRYWPLNQVDLYL